MRSNGLNDFDLDQIINVMKHNQSLKVIDISSNTSLSGESITKLGDILDSNRTIEYFGLAKLNLDNEHVIPLLGLLGKFPFPEDQVQNHLALLKSRDVIIEKNKKLKASKKPEEPVPALDNIE